MPPKKSLKPVKQNKTPAATQKPKNNIAKKTVHTLDATGKILGRLATEAAILLRGKNTPQFRPNLVLPCEVIIINASKIKISGNKLTDKRYYRHSGYLGNLKSESLADVMRKNPSEVIRRAVKGMLPKNKLQDKWMKNLVIYNGEING